MLFLYHHGSKRRTLLRLLSTCVVITILSHVVFSPFTGPRPHFLVARAESRLGPIYLNNTSQFKTNSRNKAKNLEHLVTEVNHQKLEELLFLIVICDIQDDAAKFSLDRQLRQTTTLLKSAFTLTNSHLRFIVAADSIDVFKKVKVIADEWLSASNLKLSFEYLEVSYPENRQDMVLMFKPCATFRLFVPPILKSEDAIIYIDTDFIFMSSPDDLWNKFHQFQDSEIMAMTTPISRGDKKDLARHRQVPLYKDGLNGGIMLMNLTRINSMEENFLDTQLAIYDKYIDNITMADQDILNIYFSEKPWLMHHLGCEYNYRRFLCRGGVNMCPSTDADGVALLHGNGNVFVENREYYFQNVFESWSNFSFGSPIKTLYEDIIRRYEASRRNVGRQTKCGSMTNIQTVITEQLRRIAYND